MIIKSFEISKINFNKNNFYLLYGENEGYKNEVIKKYFEKIYPNSIYRHDENQILDDKDKFLNGLLSKSFFDIKKLIIISRVSDKIVDFIEKIISKNIKDITIILSAKILEKKSKLRNFFEKEKKIICVPFYADSNQTLNSIALKFFKEKKISISQQTINLLIERCRGNRENLNNELEKIENFSKSKKKINSDDILKLTNLVENYTVTELTDNCLAQNIKKTTNILNENHYSTEDCILITRTLLIKTKRLLKIQEEINSNKNIEEVVANFKPPIFWKDKEIVKKQIANWPLKKIKNMITNINNIELLIKKNSINSLNILSDFIITQTKK